MAPLYISHLAPFSGFWLAFCCVHPPIDAFSPLAHKLGSSVCLKRRSVYLLCDGHYFYPLSTSCLPTPDIVLWKLLFSSTRVAFPSSSSHHCCYCCCCLAALSWRLLPPTPFPLTSGTPGIIPEDGSKGIGSRLISTSSLGSLHSYLDVCVCPARPMASSLLIAVLQLFTSHLQN